MHFKYDKNKFQINLLEFLNFLIKSRWTIKKKYILHLMPEQPFNIVRKKIFTNNLLHITLKRGDYLL